MKLFRLNLQPMMCFMVSLTLVDNVVAQEMNNETTRDFVGASIYSYCGKWQDGTCAMFCVDCNGSLYKFGNNQYYQYHSTMNIDVLQDISYYFRQDGDVVYRYDEKKNEEAVAFDFGLEVGDNFTDLEGNRFVVSMIKDTLVIQEYDNKKMGVFKKLILDGIDNPELHDVWLEGVGSLYTGILGRGELSGREMFAFYDCDICETSLLNVKTRLYNVQMNVDEDFVKAHHTPNMLERDEFYGDYINDDKTPNIQIEFKDDSLHIQGTLWVPTYNDLYVVCLVFDDNVKICYSFIQTGPAVFGMSPYGIDTWFSGFDKGSYLVKFPGCDDVEAVCDGSSSPTSVMDLPLDNRQNNTTMLYDISGRRLTSEPRQGIYIKDGKKYILRR